MQAERSAAERESAAAAEIEELRRQLEGAGQELDEWRSQVADASEQAQLFQCQLQDRTQQLSAAQVCNPASCLFNDKHLPTPATRVKVWSPESLGLERYLTYGIVPIVRYLRGYMLWVSRRHWPSAM